MSNYDPMTGEPIGANTEEAPIVGYDPMTGEPIRKEEAPSVGYNPMTGEPIRKEEEAPIVGYDPMTGEPIRENEQMSQQEVNFDPMTGTPVVPGTTVAGYTASNGGGKKLPIIIGSLVAVVAVAVLIVGLIFSGVFTSIPNKVLAAFVNTFKETSGMTEAVRGFDVVLGDSYTIGMEVDVEGEYIDLQYAANKNEKQISGSINVEDVPEIEFLAGIDSSEVKFQAPDLTDYVFIYNYKEEKDGYIVDEMGDDSIEALDMMCELIYAQKQQKDAMVDVVNLYKDTFAELEFEKVDKKEYEVDGKDRKCKGYRTTITEDDINDFIDVLEDGMDEEYVDALEKMDIDVTEMYDEMRYEIEDMEDIEVTFYIYKNKLACINLDDDDNEIEILFKGCEKGMYNIEFCEDDETVFEIIGSVDGSIETYKIEEDGSEVMSVEYDTKSGDYEIKDEYDTTVKGNLKSDSKGVTFTVEEVEDYGDSVDMTVTVTAEKGATMQKFDGEEFDLGNASEDDIMDLVMDLYPALY